MSQFSEEDRPVVEFLRQYRPPVPPAQPELEDRVMEAIPRFHRRPKRPLWLVSGTLAAGFLAAIATHSILSPRGGYRRRKSPNSKLMSNAIGVSFLEEVRQRRWKLPKFGYSRMLLLY
uniref:Uncharacterized protein n=1 Tax=Desertifilum tharense IPPAS B-1220 TaxID=1781255 RepID=A0ACD5GZA7_9CYAN